MMNLEDKIIAYLDGTLDETSRAELLHTLSVSPEKRKLLEEHIKLREIISLGHKPASVPLMTERKLADRIPILMQELPYLAEKSSRIAPFVAPSSTSYFTLFGRQVSSFFTSRLGQVVSLGTLALVGGLSWYIASSDGDSELRTPKTDIVQTHNDGAKQAAPNPSTLDASKGTISAPSATAAQSLNDAKHTSSSSRVQLSISKSAQKQVAKTNVKANRSDSQMAINNGESTSSTNAQASLDQASQQASSTEEKNSAQSNDAASTNSSDNSEKSASSVNSQNTVQQNSEQPNAIKDPKDLPPLPLPSDETNVTGRFIGQVEYQGSFNVRPNVKSQQYETTSGIGSVIGGFGWEFDRNIAVGLEFGNSSLSQQQQEKTVTPRASQGPMGSAISVNDRVTYATDVKDVNAPWGQATLRYTFNPDDVFRFEAIGGAGAALVDGDAAPMVSLGGAVTYDLHDRVAFTVGVTGRGAWLNGLNAEDEATSTVGGGNATAIVSHRPLTDDLFSSSIGFRAGIRISPFKSS